MGKKELVNSFSSFKMMKRMSLHLNSKHVYSITEICKETGIDNHSPVFQDIIRLLKEEGIIDVKRLVGRMQLVEINIDKLNKFIESTPIWEEFAEYVRNNKLIYANI